MVTAETFLVDEKEVAEFKLQFVGRLVKTPGPVEENRRKRTSNVAMVESVLAAAGRPLHISETLASVVKNFGESLDRDSVTSAIAKQIRKGKRFIRADPNTWGLPAPQDIMRPHVQGSGKRSAGFGQSWFSWMLLLISLLNLDASLKLLSNCFTDTSRLETNSLSLSGRSSYITVSGKVDFMLPGGITCDPQG